MTIKEQIYIEDKYRSVREDIDFLLEKEEHYEVDFNEVDEFLEELHKLREIQYFIENFISFSGYHFRECESGWTLFENEED